MLIETVKPIQAGIMVLAATLAPAALVFLASAISNLSIRFWRGRQTDSHTRTRRIHP